MDITMDTSDSSQSKEWKGVFATGIALFRAQQYEEALARFSEAISLGSNDASVYDSRAAVYEKLNKKKEALMDSRQVIRLAPDQWKGYARSARLFHGAHKYDSALKMVDMTLERVKPEDEKRVAEFISFREKVVKARDAELERQRQKASEEYYHFGKLPLELATAVFSTILDVEPSFVVVLAAVCRPWREAVLATPAFWRSLVLTTKEPSRKAKLWKARCQGKLERLDVRRGDDMKVMWAVHEFERMPLTGLRELALQGVRPDHFFKMLPTCTPAVLRELESLRLDSLVLQQDALTFTMQPFARLRTLHVDNTPVHWPNLADNCHSLRELFYNGAFPEEHIADVIWCICNNPELESLDLHWASTAAPFVVLKSSIDRSQPPEVALPKLKNLGLRAGPLILLVGLIRSIIMPSLETLHLSSMAVSVDFLFSRWSSTGSLSHLTELKLEALSVSEVSLTEVFVTTPRLQTLSLSKLSVANFILEALATATPSVDGDAGQPQVLCPKLTTLVVNHCPDVKTGPVIRIVKLRNDVPAEATGASDSDVARINTLSLDGCEIDSEHLPWFRRRVPIFSCVYQTRKEAKSYRR